MKRITISTVCLLAIASFVWFGVSNRIQIGSGTGPANPAVEPQLVVQDQNDQSRKQTTDQDNEMVAFEKRIGRKFTEEERRLKPPEMGWTAWGQYVDVHRMQSFKNGPVSFHGLVVTPDDEPIPGVEMTAEIRKYTESIAEKLIRGDSTKLEQIPLVTDEEGRFSIKGEDGTNLQIFDFTKEGYELVGEKTYWGASFNPHVPNHHKADPENPEIFTMKKVE